MTDLEPTFEEARRCPKCGFSGDERLKTVPPRNARLPQGTYIVHIYCVTPHCRWFNTPWTVQVNPDGTVPPPRDHSKSPKLYDPKSFKGHDEMARRVLGELERQANAEIEKGAEMKNPNG